MRGICFLAALWTVLLKQNRCVCTDVVFLERQEGGSALLSCQLDPTSPAPYGLYVKRAWLRRSNVLFMHSGHEFNMEEDADKSRTAVSGDPRDHYLNVTLSQLRPGDTDRYYCEFMVENKAGEDLGVRGKTEFFLLVTSDAPGSLDVGLVETCAGGSAVLPCLPPPGDDLPVEGVSLKRQRGREVPMEVYHSKRHHGSSAPSSSSSSTQFSTDRVQLSSAPGPSGLTFNLTLKQLQPEDSALYSCQLLLRGRPDSRTGLGRQMFFVSVQGGQCGCSSYSTLLYALSSAVAVLFLLLLGFVVVSRGKAGRSAKSQPLAPIYEEMSGVQPLNRKLAPSHLEDMEGSEYRNCTVKKSCPENHYESPTGGLYPRRGSQK